MRIVDGLTMAANKLVKIIILVCRVSRKTQKLEIENAYVRMIK
jgi:hypothetical protein